MAMHTLTHKQFSAWVTVGGETLPVYQQEVAGTVCSAWIASTAGQHFSVWWKDDSKERIATSGHVFIDGHDVASAIMRPGRSKPVERMGAKISARKLKPFTFSVLRLTDDDTIANKHDPSVKEVGIIRIEITRVKLGEEVPFKGYEAEDHGMVHEKAKKTGAHCTSYGPDQRAAATRTTAVTTAPYEKSNAGPYVTFIFKYKSQDLLRADGIIRTPNNKRDFPQDDEEVIVISDSEDSGSDKEDPKDGSLTKRPKIERGAASQPSQNSKADGGGKTSCATDDGDGQVESSGAPSLPLQQAEQDESQTQVDDDETQFTFGAPSLLQQEASEDNTTFNQQSQEQVEVTDASTSVKATEDVSTELEGPMKVAILDGVDEGSPK